jgi:hypothetical protein
MQPAESTLRPCDQGVGEEWRVPALSTASLDELHDKQPPPVPHISIEVLLHVRSKLMIMAATSDLVNWQVSPPGGD